MTGLLITAGILLLLAGTILFAPFSLRASCRDGRLGLTVHFLFFRLYDFFPSTPRKKKEKKAGREKKRKEEEQPPEDKGGKKSRKASETACLLWRLALDSRWGLRYIRRRVVFYRIAVCISVGGSDAHRTAMSYVSMCAVVGMVLDVLSALFPVKQPEVRIAPDFLAGENVYDISLRARIRLASVLTAAAVTSIRFLHFYIGKRKKRQHTKGGKAYEPATSNQ